MNTTRKSITTAALIALVVFMPAFVLLLVAYQLSRNQAMSSVIFLGSFLADLFGVCWWISHITPARRRARMSVHDFVAHMKMHPELMPPGMTEFDLECFRTRQRRSLQPGLDAWLRQFRGGITTRPASQTR